MCRFLHRSFQGQGFLRQGFSPWNLSMSFLGTVGSFTMFLVGLAAGAVLELEGAVVAGLAVGGGALGWSPLHMLG